MHRHSIPFMTLSLFMFAICLSDQSLGQRTSLPREGAQKENDPVNERTGPAPVRIGVGPDGRLVISSTDTAALDVLEDLLIQQNPLPRSYKIFKLLFADAYDVKLILEDFFEEEEEQKNRSSPFMFFFWDDFGSNDKKKTNRLSSRRPIKFIRDAPTNSIVVQHADAVQLATVEELIKYYDKPEPPDSQTVRKMIHVQLRYADSQTMVDKVKEVFIDLLTPNDKARQKPKGEGGGSEEVINFNYGSSSSGELVKVPKFKGQLHLTADTASNSVVILAPVYILRIVEDMVRHLDDAAKPSTDVQVVKLDGTINAGQVRETLAKMLGEQVVQTDKKNTDGKPPEEGQQNGGNAKPGGK